MRLNFLEAADNTALTKTFSVDSDGTLTESSYPLISKFTSYEESSNSIDDTFTLLKKYAANKACLLKGLLTKPLVSERRAGKTRRDEATQLLILDLDFNDGYDSVDEFLADLDPMLKGVDYIFQHSASSGIKGASGLRGHVFMHIEKPVNPHVLKQWLISKNLHTKTLRSRVELSANGQALKYPLDVTVCQNDKLIYIAPPICNGLNDPMTARISIHKRGCGVITGKFTCNPAKNADDAEDLKDELRKAAGLKKRKGKYKDYNGEQLLLNPDVAVVTGIKQERGFVYLNLNGGDSWAYYFPEDNPDFLFNFKGEPIVRLKDIAPDFYAGLFPSKEEKQETIRPVTFRDVESDTLFNGLYNPTKNTLDMHPVQSEGRIKDFLAQHGEEMPEFIEQWKYEFNPTTTKIIDFDNRWANRFVPSPYLTEKSDVKTVSIPPTIDRVIGSVCVDEATKEHFMNWLAYIFQTRKKAKTAWIFHGTEGTGKGVLYSKILRPLFGPRYANQYTLSNLKDNFNAAISETIIMFVDEFQVGGNAEGVEVWNKLKGLVTEETPMIRAMRKDAKASRVFNNIIIATNHHDPVPLSPNDRRFNVAPAQETKLYLSDVEYDLIDKELSLFANYLRNYNVDPQLVRTVLFNEARQKMISASENSVDEFFRALREGDMDYFLKWLKIGNTSTPDFDYMAFQKVIKNWAEQYHKPESFLVREDVMAAYKYCVSAKSTTPTKFARLAKIHRITFDRRTVDGKRAYGFSTPLQGADPQEILIIAEPKPQLIQQEGQHVTKTHIQ